MSSASNSTILELHNIRKAFPGVLALDDVSFAVKVGEVHGLVGENGAGKSTLIKILSGVYTLDSGSIVLDSKPVRIRNPHDAHAVGIEVMHQEISIFPKLTVAENIWMHHFPQKAKGWLDIKELHKKTKELLSTLGLDHIDTRQKMEELSLADQQLTNLARLVSTNPQIVLLDEPTASLTKNEIDLLFRVIINLKNAGVSIIYISHFIDEVMSICDRITVLRDGRHIVTVPTLNTTNEDIVRHMVGKTVRANMRNSEVLGEAVLQLMEVSTANKIKFINLTLRENEVLGIYGLNGAGKTEILKAISGIDKLLTGKILLNNKDISHDSSSERMRKGISYAPEDRRRLGLVLQLGVKDNLMLGNEKKTAVADRFIQKKHETRIAKEQIMKLKIVTPSIKTQIRSLSGGNQQKVILARNLWKDTKIFLLDEPTLGIDVGARYEIYQIISEIVKSRASVIIASSDLNEILRMSDNILVVANGRIVLSVNKEEANEEKLLLYAMGDNKNA